MVKWVGLLPQSSHPETVTVCAEFHILSISVWVSSHLPRMREGGLTTLRDCARACVVSCVNPPGISS